jgi:Nuclease-related domain
MTESLGLDGLRRKGARVPAVPAGARPAAADTQPVEDVDTQVQDDRVSRALIISAIGAVSALVLLMPATPMVGMVLTAAISLGVVATLVRRGEARRRTGETLERLGIKGCLVLVDRVSPGLTGTIRHLVIGPGGVFVVETRDQRGRVRIRGDQLIIGRISHSVAGQLRAQVAAVATTLAPILDGTGATVVPLICMRYAEMPLLHRTVAGIPLLRESQLERRISRATRVLDEATILRLGELADRTMPRASRHGGAFPGADTWGTPGEAVEREAVTWSHESPDLAPEPRALSSGMAFPSSPA